jgi:hypothetical protein
LEFFRGYSDVSEKNIFLAVNTNTSWLKMLVAQYSETDCRYAVGLFKGHDSHCGATSVVEKTWRPAGALQTWGGLTLDNCKKVDKTIITAH